MWFLLIAMFAFAAWMWNQVPERVPTHWSIGGHADRWGDRMEGLFLLPLEGLGLYLLMVFLPRVDPGRANYSSFAGVYWTLRVVVLLLVAVTEVSAILAYRRGATGPAGAMPIGLGALLVVTGNLAGKIRPNWFVGIRTPWTLSSKESWTRTHRAGGCLLIVLGLLIMLLEWIHSSWYVLFLAVAGALCLLGLIVYSYKVWRDDPHKVPPAGTSPAGA
jgi:uncharacterized membrane protein